MFKIRDILYDLDSKLRAYFRKEGFDERLAHQKYIVRGVYFQEGVYLSGGGLLSSLYGLCI